MEMEEVTSAIRLQVPAQPSPDDPTLSEWGGEPRLGSAQPCEPPGPVMEASVAVSLVVVAGAVILILLCAVILLCYRLRWAQSGSLQYVSFHHSARYTLKEPSQPAPPPPSLPPTIPLPPPPPTPSPPFHPTPQPPPFHPAPPLFQPAPPLTHITQPGPLAPPPDMVVYSRIGLMRACRPAGARATQVILFEHSSL